MGLSGNTGACVNSLRCFTGVLAETIESGMEQRPAIGKDTTEHQQRRRDSSDPGDQRGNGCRRSEKTAFREAGNRFRRCLAGKVIRVHTTTFYSFQITINNINNSD